MNYQRVRPQETWRPPVVSNRDIWSELPDIRSGQRAHRAFRRLTSGAVIALVVGAVLLMGSPFLVLWAMG
jgi:hypothetical protein